MSLTAPRRLAPCLCLLTSLLAGLLGAHTQAAPATTAERGCLRLLQLSTSDNHFREVCQDVLAHRAPSSDPLIETAMRRMVADPVGMLPDEALNELLKLPENALAEHADNAVFLFYASRTLRLHRNREQSSPDLVPIADKLANFAMDRPAMRASAFVSQLQGMVATTILLHLRQNDVDGAAAWLQRLEETCLDPDNCFAAYAVAAGTRDRGISPNTYRKLATLLADRHGTGDWRTGIVAMVLAGLGAKSDGKNTDGGESIFRPFLAEWIKSDVIAQQFATIDWFMTIAKARYERGDYRGSLEVTDYLWSKARTGSLLFVNVRPLAELAINTRACLGRYDEAAAFADEYEKVWAKMYAPRVRASR